MGGKPKRYSTGDASAITTALAAHWPGAECELNFRNAFELLVATILSAQSTDRRVNLASQRLFAEFPNAHALAAADPNTVEELIHSTGFFRQKTRNIIAMAQSLVKNHGGEVPRTMEELVRLPGVARKTANVVLGSAYGIPSGIVVDTHVKRLSQRLGLTTHTDPVKIERDLQAQVPEAEWINFGHRLIWHGRRLCHARKPECDHCQLAPTCPSSEVR